MSETRVIEGLPARARDVERRAAAWISRCEQRELSGEELAEFDAWLAESLAHRVAYWRLNAAWSRTKRLAALRLPLSEQGESAASRRPWRIFGRVAAGIAVVISLVAGGAFLIAKPDTQAFATAVGGHKILKLADGSWIELNTDTQLRTSVNSHFRTVWLDRGEAYFQVRHDADHPFTVMVGDRRVTDLGTAFTVRRDSDDLKIAVVQGRVLFDTIDRAKTPTLLAEGDIAIAHGNSLSVTKKDIRNLVNETAWRRGVLVFDRVTLAAAAAEFNRYNREQLVIVDDKAAHRTIGATFPIHDVDQFVDVTQEVLGLHVEKRGDRIVISR